MEKGIPARLTAREGRRFAFSVGTVFLFFGGIALWRNHHAVPLIFGGLGIFLLVAGALFPSNLGPIHMAWMKLAYAISKIMNPIFMGVVYFVVICPVGLAMRFIGRNPIRHRSTGGSFWFKRNPTRSNMTNQF